VSFVILARLAGLAIPLTLFWKGVISDQASLVFILGCTLLWYGAQGVAYVTYISWLSVLVPDRHWGRFFAKWEIASLGVSIVVPTGIGLLRSHVLPGLSPTWQAWSYGLIFAVGGGIVLLSILPMLTLPDGSMRTDFNGPILGRSALLSSLLHPNYRMFVLHSWWLAFFQGLTQSVAFLYQTRVLEISLTTFYLMNGTMLLLQIPLSVLGGYWSERDREREVLLPCLIAVSCAMGFYVFATPQRWWLLWGAYVCWGLFGVINVCLRNLNLKLSPRGDNTLHLSMVTQWGGGFAALAGFLGGWWLDSLIQTPINGQSELWPFQVIFVTSWLGRATAPLWLLRIHPGSPPSGEEAVT
jgi:hypothetical protein